MNTSNLSRREWLKLASGVGLASFSLASGLRAMSPGIPRTQTPPVDSAYSKRVVSLRPAGYWRLGEKHRPTAFDWSGHQHTGEYHGAPAFGEPGAIRHDSNTAIGLDGSSYVEIPNHRNFSIGAAGLTVEAWVRPDHLNFPCQANAEYIHWLGKGDAGSFEWGFRFYKKNSSRPNRISAYAWNPNGREGAGAYFEQPVTPGKWIHVVAVYQAPGKHAGVLIYRDGVLKKGPPDAPTLYSSYQVAPRHGAAPVRLGCRDLTSFLRGGLDEVAIYPRCLTADEISKNYRLAAGAWDPL